MTLLLVLNLLAICQSYFYILRFKIEKMTGDIRKMGIYQFKVVTRSLQDHLQKGEVHSCTVQALRLRTGRKAQRGSRGIALHFLDHGTRRG